MKTPYEYTKNLKNRLLTDKMLAECIYSVNKRAKNHRDRAKEYRTNHYFSFYNAANIRASSENMDKYYKMKDDFLSILSPICIHKQFVGYERKRVFSYEKDFWKLRKQKKKHIVWENSYWDDDFMGEVEFFGYETKEKKYLYFLYYELAGYSFHSPIESPKRNQFVRTL